VEERPEIEDGGGESACYAHLLCQECGAVFDEHHRETCPVVAKLARTEPKRQEEDLD
jgi:hypothetical protein